MRKERGLIASSQVVYEKYFGLGGRYYAFKVAALQASTVLLQAFGKMKLFGAALRFPEMVPAFFWMFVGLLVCNSIYPAVLLCWPRKRWAWRAAGFLLPVLLCAGGWSVSKQGSSGSNGFFRLHGPLYERGALLVRLPSLGGWP